MKHRIETKEWRQCRLFKLEIFELLWLDLARSTREVRRGREGIGEGGRGGDAATGRKMRRSS